MEAQERWDTLKAIVNKRLEASLVLTMGLASEEANYTEGRESAMQMVLDMMRELEELVG